MVLDENRNTIRNIKEFNIPVPWGDISVKAWGDENDPHILVFPGGMDNAGSFDNLIPLLPNTFHYICVDLPGHGKSSHFPAHLSIHTIDFLILIKLLIQFFKKDQYIFLGHSYGAQISLLFASLYPNYVKKIITLDVLPTYIIEANTSISYLRKKIEANINIQEKLVIKEPPSYTYDEALQKLSNSRYMGKKLSREAAESLFKRSLTRKSDGKYCFSADQRMKAYIDPLHDMRYLLTVFKNDPITVPILMIYAKLNKVPRKRYSQVLKFLESKKNVTILYVDGDHDVHINHPQMVARYINTFLLSQESKM